MSEPEGTHGTGSGDDPSADEGARRGPPTADITRSMELVRLAQDDDQDAINRLFERYYERVRLVIRMRMGRRLRGYMDSGDILQDTFMAALRGFDRFEVRDERSFIHWIGKIAENQIRGAAEYNHAQKRDRRRDQAMESVRASISGGTLRLEPADGGPELVKALGVREDLEDLFACTAELPDDQREVLSLRLFEFGDGRWDEIAEALGGLSPDAARMRYGRAVTALLRIRRQRRES